MISTPIWAETPAYIKAAASKGDHTFIISKGKRVLINYISGKACLNWQCLYITTLWLTSRFSACCCVQLEAIAFISSQEHDSLRAKHALNVFFCTRPILDSWKTRPLLDSTCKWQWSCESRQVVVTCKQSNRTLKIAQHIALLSLLFFSFSLVCAHIFNYTMSQEPQRQLGVTLPISTAPPTESELKLTEDLLQTLKDFGLFESEQEAQKRFVIAAFFGMKHHLELYWIELSSWASSTRWSKSLSTRWAKWRTFQIRLPRKLVAKFSRMVVTDWVSMVQVSASRVNWVDGRLNLHCI